MDPLKYIRERETEKPDPSGIRYAGGVVMLGGAVVTLIGGVILLGGTLSELLGLGLGLLVLGYSLGVIADLLAQFRPKD